MDLTPTAKHVGISPVAMLLSQGGTTAQSYALSNLPTLQQISIALETRRVSKECLIFERFEKYASLLTCPLSPMSRL